MNMYLVNFNLMFHHKFTLTEIEGMIPWERDVYVKLVTDYIEMENEKIRNEQQSRR